MTRTNKPQLSKKSSISEEKKKELFPFFAYLYSKELNPEKYGAAKSMEEWTALIQNNKEDIDTITKAASQLTDEDWQTVEQQYMEVQQNSQIQSIAKGARLKRLKEGSSIKKVTKVKGGMKKKHMCSCGCDLVLSKGNGGKLIESCSCKCKGGKMNKIKKMK